MIKLLCNMGKKLIEKLDPENWRILFSCLHLLHLLILTPKPLFISTIAESLMQLAVAMWLGFQQQNVSRADKCNLCYLLNVLLFLVWSFPQARLHRGTRVRFGHKERITSYRWEMIWKESKFLSELVKHHYLSALGHVPIC